MPSLLTGAIASGISGHLSSFESIATVTVGSSPVSSISFSSIPSTYQHLQIRLVAKTNRSTSPLSSAVFQFNSDTALNYFWHQVGGNGSSVFAGANPITDAINFDRTSGNSGATNIFGIGIIDILEYASLNKYKTIRALGGVNVNSAGEVELQSGTWASTSAISSITIIPGTYQATQFLQYTQFALYGVKA